VIVDAHDETYTATRWYAERIAAINGSPGWRVVYRSHGIEVLRERTAAR
jgi:3-methyladenine DNA glycosylase Mpg